MRGRPRRRNADRSFCARKTESGERHSKIKHDGLLPGTEAWPYERLHNPFALVEYELSQKSIPSQRRKAADKVMEWQDPELEYILRAALDQPDGPFYSSYLDVVKKLQIQYNEHEYLVSINDTEFFPFEFKKGRIDRLDDLVHFGSLRELYLLDPALTDISPLAQLTKLSSLVLSVSPQIDSLDALGSMEGLAELVLWAAPFDMTVEWKPPVDEKYARAYIYTRAWDKTPIDITPIRSYPPSWGESYKNIKSFDFLATLPNLELFTMRAPAVSDLAALAELPKLHTVCVESAENSDIPVLKAAELETFEVNGKRVNPSR